MNSNGQVRFSVVSDIHNFDYKSIIQTLQKINSDAVLVPGDFIQNDIDTSLGLSFLCETSKLWPVFCSSGKENYFPDSLVNQIDQTGVHYLKNQRVYFRGIAIGGLNTIPLKRKPKTEKIKLIQSQRKWLDSFSREKVYKLLLCHHPEYYSFIEPFPINLVISGHAHGGQWRMLGKGLYAPGQGLFPKYTSGLYHSRLLVSRGIGNSYRIPRINNPPEILEVIIDANNEMKYYSWKVGF